MRSRTTRLLAGIASAALLVSGTAVLAASAASADPTTAVSLNNPPPAYAEHDSLNMTSPATNDLNWLSAQDFEIEYQFIAQTSGPLTSVQIGPSVFTQLDIPTANVEVQDGDGTALGQTTVDGTGDAEFTNGGPITAGGSYTVIITGTQSDDVAGTQFQIGEAGPSSTPVPSVTVYSWQNGMDHTPANLIYNESQSGYLPIDVIVGEPIIATISPASPDGTDGWYASDPTVSFTCDLDMVSPVNCPASYLAPNGETEQSGDTPLIGGGDFSWTYDTQVDYTKPTAGVTITGTQGDYGWYTSNVTITPACSDPVSGINNCTATVAGVGPTGPINDTATIDNPYVTTNDGIFQASAQAVSGAGVTDYYSPLNVPVDTTPPTVTGTVTNVENSNGTYVGPPTVHWTCSDALSGVASCPTDTTVSGVGTDTSATVTVYDNAGNSTTVTVSNLVRGTSPVPPTGSYGAPVITIKGVTPGKTYPHGTVLHPTCTAVSHPVSIANAGLRTRTATAEPVTVACTTTTTKHYARNGNAQFTYTAHATAPTGIGPATTAPHAKAATTTKTVTWLVHMPVTITVSGLPAAHTQYGFPRTYEGRSYTITVKVHNASGGAVTGPLTLLAPVNTNLTDTAGQPNTPVPGAFTQVRPGVWTYTFTPTTAQARHHLKFGVEAPNGQRATFSLYVHQ